MLFGETGGINGIWRNRSKSLEKHLLSAVRTGLSKARSVALNSASHERNTTFNLFSLIHVYMCLLVCIELTCKLRI